MESSSSGSSKRARAPSNTIQVPACLVDGCIADLGECRDYYRRHKVCELHSKTPTVTIRGQEQRFCQQCSRFHSLGEFDEGKRSCRKRLDGHNRRRRKQQPDSLTINSGRFLSNHQGSNYTPFGSPQIFSSNNNMNSAWQGVVKAETSQDIMIQHCQSELNFSDGKTLFLGSSSHDYKVGGEKQVSFLQGDTSPPPLLSGTSSVSQSILYANSFLGTGGGGGGGGSQKTFSDGLLLTHPHTIEPNRALSLLSSPSTATQEIIGMSHLVQQPDISMPSARSLISSLHYSNHGPGLMEAEPLGSVSMSGGSIDNANVINQDLFRMEPDGSSASGPHQTVSFSWE